MVHYRRGNEIEMKIDLHIHTKTGSDGSLSVDEVFREAKKRGLKLISITDHDSVEAQERAMVLAQEYGITHLTGVELNVTFQYNDKTVSLDFLGYQHDVNNQALRDKLKLMREHREHRALQILQNLNAEFDKENIERFTEADLRKIQESVDGAFGRPHIANCLVAKGIVSNQQEAFDRYLVRCDVPKYPLSLGEASALVRNAGGILVHAHPGDPGGTSLSSITRDLGEQTMIIEQYMLGDIDGIECWHARHDIETARHYAAFARKHGLIITGGSDCHQKPVIMGTVGIPDWVAEQFRHN